VPLISFLSLKFLLDVALYSTARKYPLLIIHIFALRTDTAVACCAAPQSPRFSFAVNNFLGCVHWC
jgi:hypothetical protein